MNRYLGAILLGIFIAIGCQGPSAGRNPLRDEVGEQPATPPSSAGSESPASSGDEASQGAVVPDPETGEPRYMTKEEMKESGLIK